MVNVAVVSESFKNFSLSDWMQNPLDDTEWVNGELVEKNAYLTPDLVSQYGNQKVLPQSFPLSAEIVFPTDYAEDVIAIYTDVIPDKVFIDNLDDFSWKECNTWIITSFVEQVEETKNLDS